MKGFFAVSTSKVKWLYVLTADLRLRLVNNPSPTSQTIVIFCQLPHLMQGTLYIYRMKCGAIIYQQVWKIFHLINLVITNLMFSFLNTVITILIGGGVQFAPYWKLSSLFPSIFKMYYQTLSFLFFNVNGHFFIYYHVWYVVIVLHENWMQ